MYAFAEFRLACQKYRIDIKKPLDDAAKMVEPFVTGDALLQQLVKRRNRYLEEQQKNGDGDDPAIQSVYQAKVATPKSAPRATASTKKSTQVCLLRGKSIC